MGFHLGNKMITYNDLYKLVVQEIYPMEGYYLIRCQVSSKIPAIMTTGDILAMAVENFVGEAQVIGEDFFIPEQS